MRTRPVLSVIEHASSLAIGSLPPGWSKGLKPWMTRFKDYFGVWQISAETQNMVILITWQNDRAKRALATDLVLLFPLNGIKSVALWWSRRWFKGLVTGAIISSCLYWLWMYPRFSERERAQMTKLDYTSRRVLITQPTNPCDVCTPSLPRILDPLYNCLSEAKHSH